jgi:MoaA/NifB/PqqE/SkfB family radical SAM enzyme
MNLVRDQFRQGQKLEACQNCWRNEQAGGESKHQLTPYKLSNIYPRIDWESNSLDQNMGFIGGHLGNLCNLKCRICSPVFSSSIATEEIGQEPDIETRSHPTYKLLTDNRWHGNSEKFWQQLKDHSDQICNFEFLGGEPLLLQENLDFMQWLVDNGHSHKCIFEFISNGTQYPAVFDRANQFHRLTVTLSIDNLQQRFESERHGAKWDQVVANLQRFVSSRDAGSNIKIGVCITVNIQNVLYLPELIKWLKSQGIDHYYYNVLAKPEWISVDWLTPEARTLVIDRLVSADLPADDRVKLFYVINCVRSATTSDGAEFRKQMQSKDQIRHQNFILTHQEIAQAMGFVLQLQDD